MIKLKELLENGKEQYDPYMYSKQGFGCHVCKYYYLKEGVHMCGNEHYQRYMGTDVLLTKKGGEPITDPSRYCSNWFKPND